ncbi:MAG: NFACT family protein [Clostridia bacterium]|nr:NFACT family protein [Clostridia bacterium]
MPFDGLTVGLIADELRRTLVGGRIDRIVQPERDELLLTVRCAGQNHLLLMSAGADCARAHLTEIKKTGPLEPPALCMLMRKHITGGRISDVRQVNCDRILEILIEHHDELGDPATKRIICEFMGKHSNLIFVDGNGRIIDSARRVSEAMSSVREVLPGLRYEDPPAHGTLPYSEVTEETLRPILTTWGGKLSRCLTGSISGLSGQAAEEIAYRATGNAEAHLEELDRTALCTSVAKALRDMLTAHTPSVALNAEGVPVDFADWAMNSRRGLSFESYPTLSQCCDAFFRDRDAKARIKQKSTTLHRMLKTNLERNERKLALQQEALLGAERMEEYRVKGELLTANLHLADKGMKVVEVTNWYDPNQAMLAIELDVKLSPAQNAQRYFKLYQKARNARTLAADQIVQTSSEIDYLRGQLDNLSKCTEEAELAELRDELEKLGYVKANRNRRQMKQLPPSKPLKFIASDGTVILVGKNTLQNDKLTATAQPNEVWLHVKDMPGSHVIIVGENPTDATILEAARYAAAYSSGATSKKVPVDYTLRKYVRKPSGAKPGFVIYTHQHTLLAEPAPRSDV